MKKYNIKYLNNLANNKLIVFLGVKGSGKGHQTELLQKEGYVKVDFADALREECYELIGYVPEDYEQFKIKPITVLTDKLYEFMQDRNILNNTTAIKMTGRDLLQVVGEERRKEDINYWCNQWKDKVEALLKEGKKVCCSDCRHYNEVTSAQEVAESPTLVFCNFKSFRYDAKDSHISEELAQYLIKIGTEDLQIINKKILNKLSRRYLITKDDLKYYLKKAVTLKQKLDIVNQDIKESEEQKEKLYYDIDVLLDVYKKAKKRYSPENEKEEDKSERIFERRRRKRNKKENIILAKLSLLTNEYFWSDVKYTIRKIVRFPVRVIEYSKVLFNHEYWCTGNMLTFLEFELDRMQKSIDKYSCYVGSEKDSREVRKVIEHIKRYIEVDKYTISVDIDEYLDNHLSFYGEKDLDENGEPLFFRSGYEDEKLAEKHFRIHEEQNKLELFHWKEIWKIISRKGQNWGY